MIINNAMLGNRGLHEYETEKSKQMCGSLL